MAPWIPSEDPAVTSVYRAGPAHRSTWKEMVVARDGANCRGCGKEQERTRPLRVEALSSHDVRDLGIADLALLCSECQNKVDVRNRVSVGNLAFNDLVLQVLREEGVTGMAFGVDEQLSRHEEGMRAAEGVADDRKIEAYLRAAYDLPGQASAGRPAAKGGDVGLEGSEDAQDTSDGVAVGEGVHGQGLGCGRTATQEFIAVVSQFLDVLSKHLVGEGTAGVVGHRSSSLGDGGAGTSPGSATVEQEGGSCPACAASSSRCAGQGRDAEGGSR